MSKDTRYQVVISTYEDEESAAVYEAFLDELGQIQALSSFPVTVDGESVADIKRKLAAINYDINKHDPIMDTDLVLHNDPEPYEISLEETDPDEYEDYYVDPEKDLVDLFNRRGR